MKTKIEDLSKSQRALLKAIKTLHSVGHLYKVVNHGIQIDNIDITKIEYPYDNDINNALFLTTEPDGYHVVRTLSNCTDQECMAIIKETIKTSAEYMAEKCIQILEQDITTWIMFTQNYQHDFIEQAWKDNPNMAQHFRAKYDHLYEQYGATGAFTAFYCELSDIHRTQLVKYYFDAYYKEHRTNEENRK